MSRSLFNRLLICENQLSYEQTEKGFKDVNSDFRSFYVAAK